MAIRKKDSFRHPLSYMGVEAYSPPQITIQTREPSTFDKKYSIGDIWIIQDDSKIFMLSNILNGSASWVKIYPNTSMPTGSDVSLFVTDSGSAIPVMNILNVLGDVSTTTSGAANTVTLALTDGINGQILIGSTGNSPQWGTITSTGGTVTITNGSNSINLETNTIGVSTYATDAGNASPAGNALNVLGGTNISTSGSTNIVTVDLDSTSDIGGTITLSGLSRGVVQSTSSGLLFSNEGIDGQVIISSSSSAPAWANLSSSDASITISEGANTLDLSTAVGGGGALGTRYAFLANLNSNSVAVGTSTPVNLGSQESLTINFDPEGVFYVGEGTFSSGDPALFTCTQEGKYLISHQIRTSKSKEPLSSRVFSLISTISSNRTYKYKDSRSYDNQSSQDRDNCKLEVIADMEVGDTVYWTIAIYSSVPDVTILGDFRISGGINLETNVSGILVA